jgi:NADH:ubiquinone oxidoreductase subunit 6 (subunit J)
MHIVMPPLFAATSSTWLSQAMLVLPLVLGAAGLYLLLPRPEPRSAVPGALVALLGLILAAVFFVPTGRISAETFLFYCFSAVALIAGALLVTQSNPARAALAFAVAVLSVCGLFLLLAAPFLMAATIIIYAGAIIVTFLFVLMLAQQERPSNADVRSREPALATLTGFLLFGVLVYLLHSTYGSDELEGLIEETREAEIADNPQQINEKVAAAFDGKGLLFHWETYYTQHGMEDLAIMVKNEITGVPPDTGWVGTLTTEGKEKRVARLEKLVAIGKQARLRLGELRPLKRPLSDLSGTAASEPPENFRRDEAGRPLLPADNPAYLGRSLFTDYLLPVELGGTLLLTATIGAIAIAHRRSPTASRPSRAT